MVNIEFELQLFLFMIINSYSSQAYTILLIFSSNVMMEIKREHFLLIV